MLDWWGGGGVETQIPCGGGTLPTKYDQYINIEGWVGGGGGSRAHGNGDRLLHT